MASEGLGAEETAEDLGVTAHSVGEYLPSEVTRREHLTRASKRRARARRLAAEGPSPRQTIAAMMGTGQSPVQGNLYTDVAPHGAEMVRFGQRTRILSRLAWRPELLSAEGLPPRRGMVEADL